MKLAWVQWTRCASQLLGAGLGAAVGLRIMVGAILAWDAWHALAERLRARGVTFVIEPRIRFAGQVGEQATFFVRDPAGNALEFKSFRDPSRVFAR